MFLRNIGIVPEIAKAEGDNSSAGSITNLSRRNFVAGSGLFVIGVTLAGCSNLIEPDIDPDAFGLPDPGPSPLMDVAGGDASPALWISIDEDGTVTITCHRSEMGQQTWTAMAQIVADELEADWETVKIVQAEGHERYGDQNTDGSRSVRYNFHRLRTAGAAMRHMLTAAAAAYWEIEPAQCSASEGIISNSENGETISYGTLAELAGRMQVPGEEDISLKEPKDWRFIGKEISSLTIPLITQGEGTFGIDVDRPDMIYAVVARSPQVFGKLASVDDAACLAVPGVIQTVALPDPTPPAAFQQMGGVAVLARDTWAAIQGRKALEIEWADGPNAGYNSDSFAQTLMQAARRSAK